LNYYPHHIGDYARDTAHLSLLEDGAYRRMLDLCYRTEAPLPLERDKLYRLLRVKGHSEKLAVDVVLGEFFIEGEDGWHQRRVEEELTRAHEKSAKASASAAKRWHSQGNAKAMRTHSEGNAPNSQEPITREKSASHGSRLSAAWEPRDELRAWAASERPDLDLKTTLAKFRDYWTAKPGKAGVKLDWEATFRNWVREERGSGKLTRNETGERI
jgi:uncharacterized protein YdaU (DUF1376 family)